MTKKIALMVEDMYQVLELWYPYYRLKEAGYSVELIGAEQGRQYQSKEGYPAVATLAAGSANPEQFACMIVPGGYAPDHMRRSPDILNFANALVDGNKIIAAICHGGWLLCSTKIYKGKRATCFMSIKDDIVNAGAAYVDEECVVDHNLITSRMPDDLPAFCTAILVKLGASGR